MLKYMHALPFIAGCQEDDVDIRRFAVLPYDQNIARRSARAAQNHAMIFLREDMMVDARRYQSIGYTRGIVKSFLLAASAYAAISIYRFNACSKRRLLKMKSCSPIKCACKYFKDTGLPLFTAIITLICAAFTARRLPFA